MNTQASNNKDSSKKTNMIENLIKLSFERVNALRSNPIDVSDVRKIDLYGDNGVFDSLGLVTFLNMIESVFTEEAQITVSLMSEKAMSQKVSPFQNTNNLIAFIEAELS